MDEIQGKCPSCDAEGVIGRPCQQRVCLKRGYRFVPTEAWVRAHDGGAPDPMIGVLVGDFLIIDFVGAGGFGKVYLALQGPMFRLKGALKLIDYEADDELGEVLLEKFRGEADVLAQIHHPNIVRLIKYGDHDGRPYLVMEYVEEGRTLQDEMVRRFHDDEVLDPVFTLHIIEQILNALEHMHEAGIIHRDIKPDNIMLQRVVGNPSHVRILDFGLAKVVAHQDHTQLPLGTPLYMAPEQLSMTNLGPWTDLYAVAAIACWLVTGRRPFPGESKTEIIPYKLKPGFDPGARLAGAGFADPVVGFFRDALAFEPEDRIRSAAEFRHRLHELLDEGARDTGRYVPPAPAQDPTTRLASDEVLEVASDEVAELLGGEPTPSDRITRRAEGDEPARVLAGRQAVPEDERADGEAEDEPGGASPRPPQEAAWAEGPEVGPTRSASSGAGRERWWWGLPIVALAVAGAALWAQRDPPAPEPEPAPAPKPAPRPQLDRAALEARIEARQRALSDVGLARQRALRAQRARGEELGSARAAALEARATASDAAAAEANTPHVTDVAAGKFHTCALLWDGRVRCWGANFGGELGLRHDRTIGDDEPPLQAPPVELGARVVSLAASSDRGSGHTCAVDDQGSLRCWGRNDQGQLGLGHTRNIGDDELPGAVGIVAVGDRVRQVVVAAAQHTSHTCALLQSGQVRCWGDNKFGQLGLGHTDDIGDDERPRQAPPVPLGGLATQIAAGKHHTCAILEGGQVRCWGFNKFGQLGLGHTDDVGDDETPEGPAPLVWEVPVRGLALGRQHSCARLEGGRVVCWGDHEHGQLGLGEPLEESAQGRLLEASAARPVELGGRASQVVAGDLHTCALLEGGGVRCWGDNKFGQLGASHTRTVGDDETPATQADVVLGAPATRLAAGSYHTCAVLQSGQVRCWGFNKFGQLGLGHTRNIGDTETPSSVPPISILEAPEEASR